ncbi:MAG TPA: glycosyltransferase [bacterium]|nr:glycosyltransferase [bacterium]
MRVLLVDTSLYAPASPFFVDAAHDAGYNTRFIDDAPYLRPLETSLVHKIAYRMLGRRPLTSFAFNRLLHVEADRFRPEIVLAVKSPFVTPATLRRIKAGTGAILVNYATDDPFNPANATPDLRHGIPIYDVYACTKRAIMEDVRRAGCRTVIYTMFGYKPSVHFPERPATNDEARRFRSDVVVVGGADPDRLRELEPLLAARDVTLALYGGYWSRDRRFAPYARGFAVGRDYRLALGGARIALCLVRRANRDGHAMRSFEIPACGAFMLAERTAEHLALFREDEEAAFFGSPDEMLDKVRYYLAHDDVRRRIAEAGHVRVTTGGHTYLDRLREIARTATGLRPDVS